MTFTGLRSCEDCGRLVMLLTMEEDARGRLVCMECASPVVPVVADTCPCLFGGPCGRDPWAGHAAPVANGGGADHGPSCPTCPPDAEGFPSCPVDGKGGAS